MSARTTALRLSNAVRLAAVAFTLAAALPAVAPPQALAQYNSFNQRDDKYRLLGLKRSKEYFEMTRREFDRQKELFDKGLISQAELDRFRNGLADAEVNYQQSLLSVLFEQQYVSIDKAVKYQAADGSKHVRLSVANASGNSEEFRKLLGIEDELFRTLQPDVIQSVYISLYNNDGAIVSQPYEFKVEELRAGKPKALDFLLLQDLDALTVNIIYGNGSSRTLKILLQKDNTGNRVAVQAQQFSQEAELGKTASYGLTLELFGGLNTSFQLVVANLPLQVNRYFKDASTQARLSQIKFTESVNTMRASLEVSLPDRPTDQIAMDRAIPFYVMAVPAARAAELKNAESKTWTEDEIHRLGVGYAKLELMPRGAGRLLVRAPQLYFAVKPGEPVVVTLDLVNEGTRRLDNVKIDVDLPMNWTKTVEPAVVPMLDINQEKRVTLTATPPDGIAAGRYEIRLRTSGLSDNSPVNAEDKTVTAELVEGANVFGTIIVVLAILGIVGGIVVFGVRMSKK